MKSKLFLSAMLAGVIGAGIMSITITWARSVGLTPMNPELTLGSLLTRKLNQDAYQLGAFLHLINGGFLGILYALGFRWIGRAGIGIGALFGFFHWTIVGLLMTLAPEIHPLIPEEMASPGPMGIHLGRISSIIIFIEHIAFGALVGGIYQYFFLLQMRMDQKAKEQKAA